MPSIDFPDNTNTYLDNNGVRWHKINNSWVKQLAYVTEGPIDGTEYIRKDGLWIPVIYPVATDVGVLNTPDDGKVDPGSVDITYARRNNGWVPLEAAFGPAFTLTDGALYGVRDGAWDIFSAEDFTGDVYSQDYLDAEFATKAEAIHLHAMADITDAGTLAIEDDVEINSIDYVRRDKQWEPLVLQAKPLQSKAITIIDPISTDDALIFYTTVACTVQSIHAVALGSGTQGAGGGISFNILVADAANGSATFPIALFIDQQSSIDNPSGSDYIPDIKTIPPKSWVWVQINSGVGVNTTMFHLSIEYTES